MKMGFVSAAIVISVVVASACDTWNKSGKAGQAYGCFEAVEKTLLPAGTSVFLALPLGERPSSWRPENTIRGTITAHGRAWIFFDSAGNLDLPAMLVLDMSNDQGLPRGYEVWDPCSEVFPLGRKTALSFMDPQIKLDDGGIVVVPRDSTFFIYWFPADSVLHQKQNELFVSLTAKADSNAVAGGREPIFNR
ncbi:MAG: hypothetical protein A2939_00980 [Parcubacteria group bacterium RIFCSPLOWO2_01_FULL_48_18]|nr:MAG: hypothetical protein A3J67_04865 [Parcubacteria group bacterium RIFCSPHIGHO2_02_FULL_48_10b]OHB22046.1 MAG: hypothetical protein A2939_00980 [Parcubacteria group bacterium RIFCSPLOWO2_01_FULL_48_18]